MTPGVFVGAEVRLEVSFAAAQATLADLICGGVLGSASQQAYSDGITGLARVSPPDSAPGLPRLIQVRFQDLTVRGDQARLALRWEVTGPGGGLFPALDADLVLAPAGRHCTTLTLAAAYRAPPGTVGAGLDRAALRRVAAATIRAFLHRVAEAIAHPAGAAGSATQAADPGPSRPPPEPETP